uniref:Uncharacterized protein n=1 Tax=Tetraselmis sp. GSL018 TaxID=582737 RepID=A0A061S6X2_9CHLO
MPVGMESRLIARYFQAPLEATSKALQGIYAGEKFERYFGRIDNSSVSKPSSSNSPSSTPAEQQRVQDLINVTATRRASVSESASK